MKAISIIPGAGDVHLTDISEPQASLPDQVKIQIIEVGICGTDREEAEGGRADAPKGSKELVIGHEMLGRVVDVGSGVTKVKPGDYTVCTVRRGCGRCMQCLNHRSDMCSTGDYTERGIKESHGFQTEYIVDTERYIVKVPHEIASLGVLTEPLSVAEKAIDEAEKIQAMRLPNSVLSGTTWLKGKKVLVAGVGAIGLLAAFVLRLRGAEVIGLDIVDENTIRPQILKQIGGQYLDGRTLKTTDIDSKCGHIDLIFEATGVAKLGFELIDALGINGIYVMTGIPGGDRPICISGAHLMQQLVLKNQILLGSVNASPEHFQMAVDDLVAFQSRWPEAIGKVITSRINYLQFKDALFKHSEEEIKTVISWNPIEA